ncbi:MAG: phosphoadenosine phosphosulfate reductase family protein [Methanosarcinaceae archaeon]|nr:phosphoadenosine phosphosulfate reductase family protein [Methanosarcinaceae archaeon]
MKKKSGSFSPIRETSNMTHRPMKKGKQLNKLPQPKRAHPPQQSRKNTPFRPSSVEEHIFWCDRCNVALIGNKCGICGQDGSRLDLSAPGDVRFCSPYERGVLAQQLLSAYNCDPIGERIVLLNKIPGDDRTDEVIVDGLVFGVLYFDLRSMDFRFKPSADGAAILVPQTDRRTVVLEKTRSHLSGKKVRCEHIREHSSDIRKGDPVLVVSGDLVGVGFSYIDSITIDSSGNDTDAVKVRKVRKGVLQLNPTIASMGDVIKANLTYLQRLGKDAMNTVKGIANQPAHRDLEVHVSFSGGKDSLVVLDLALSALKKRSVQAFFLNTGLEFPETVDFVHHFCEHHGVDLVEEGSGTAFWDHVDSFGPPAKDFRWCCKICKLAPANVVIEDCRNKGTVCLTVDGKRKYESFSRSKISSSEMNPFVPEQLNIFPIRNWRAIEVWLYIYWRGMEYNPLYDMGFERVGCYLCPSSLTSEYQRLGEIHPEMYEQWNSYLLRWAKKHGLSREYVKHGFWRWRELPAKMIKLAEHLNVDTRPRQTESSFSIRVTSGSSPCKDGSFSAEGVVEGVTLNEAAAVMNVLGHTVHSNELGMVLVKTPRASIKIFSTGAIKVTGATKDAALSAFNDAAVELLRVNKCTECGICLKACPIDAIEIGGKHGSLFIRDSCIQCGKCTEACVVIKYSDKLLPDILEHCGLP